MSDLALACPNCGRALADLATASARARSDQEERVDSEEFRELSLQASRGCRIDLLAVLLAAVVTLTIASFTRPIPSVPWSKYRVPIDALARYSIATDDPGGRAPIDVSKSERLRVTPRVVASLDVVALAIVGIAIARGVFIGTLRVAVSIAVLGAAVIAVKVWNTALANWLQSPTGVSVRYDVAPWLAGVLLAVAAFGAVATFARVMREDARAAGRSAWDRLGGGALGLAEGLIVVGLAAYVFGAWLGRSHEWLAGSHSLALLERSEQLSGSRAAAPPGLPAPSASR